MPKFTQLACAILALATAAAIAATGCSAGRDPVSKTQSTQTVTDVLGRKVKIALPAHRVLLDGARILYTTAFLNPKNPLANIVGLPNDLAQNDPDSLNQYRKKFPDIDEIHKVGQVYDGSFSVEDALRQHPDVFIISEANFKAAQDAHIIDRLDRSGIPTVTVDYFDKPLEHSVPSVLLLGKIFGQVSRSREFASYYQAAVDQVRDRLKRAKASPTSAFLWRAPGYFDCCSSFKDSNLAELITFAGGDNLANHVLKSDQGTVSAETVLRKQPDVIIATGANWAPGTPAKPGSFVPLGYAESPHAAASQFSSIVSRQSGFDQLNAVKNHRTYVVWHHFYDSPYNFLAIEWFAKWLHPDLFRDVDPTKTIQRLHAKFLPIAYGGAFWAKLP